MLKQQYLDSLGTGTTFKAINRGVLENIEIPVPKSVEEQNNIVNRINLLFNKVEKVESQLNNLISRLDTYKESVLNAAIRGKIFSKNSEEESISVVLERIQHEKEKLFKEGRVKKEKPFPPIELDEIPFKLPKGWEWTRLSQLIISGPTNGVYLPQTLYGNGSPILRIDDFNNEACKSSKDLRKVNATKEQIDRYSLKLNNLVINRVNSMSHLGKCVVIKSNMLPSLYESNMMSCQLSSIISADYVCMWLQSILGRKILLSNAKQAVNQASINQRDVMFALVPLPPVAQQIHIMKIVNQTKGQLRFVSQKIERGFQQIKLLKKSILKKAFEGNLT